MQMFQGAESVDYLEGVSVWRDVNKKEVCECITADGWMSRTVIIQFLSLLKKNPSEHEGLNNEATATEKHIKYFTFIAADLAACVSLY